MLVGETDTETHLFSTTWLCYNRGTQRKTGTHPQNKSKMTRMEHMRKTKFSGPSESESLQNAVFKATTGSVQSDG